MGDPFVVRQLSGGRWGLGHASQQAQAACQRDPSPDPRSRSRSPSLLSPNSVPTAGQARPHRLNQPLRPTYRRSPPPSAPVPTVCPPPT